MPPRMSPPRCLLPDASSQIAPRFSIPNKINKWNKSWDHRENPKNIYSKKMWCAASRGYVNSKCLHSDDPYFRPDDSISRNWRFYLFEWFILFSQMIHLLQQADSHSFSTGFVSPKYFQPEDFWIMKISRESLSQHDRILTRSLREVLAYDNGFPSKHVVSYYQIQWGWLMQGWESEFSDNT